MDEATIFRMAERILAVLIGGICIFLGYRLFLHIPEQKEGEGKVEFPGGASVFVTRVGPGVFFALFGALVVGASFFKGIEVEKSKPAAVVDERRPVPHDTNIWSSEEKSRFAGASGAMEISDRQARADARVGLRKEIEILNNLPTYLRSDLPEQDRTLVERAISRIKFALMKPVWGDASEGWGDPEDFEKWRQSGDPAHPPVGLTGAVEFYNLGWQGK